MPASTKSPHFEGHDVLTHLKKARQKGAVASGEIHGTEASGAVAAWADSTKESAVVLSALTLILTALGIAPPLILWTLVAFSLSYLFWKTGRSALLGWHRLERLHRLIEEERFEVKHHRSQEREELTAMYAQKGFRGKLLTDVIDVLMADDNRLLQVMLEEELGLRLEAHEHPLQQALCAGLGVMSASMIGIGAFYFGSLPALLGGLGIVFALATGVFTRRQGNALARSMVWSLAVGAFVLGFLYLLIHSIFAPYFF